MNGSKHYVAIELDDALFDLMDNDSEVTATIFIPYTNSPNPRVSSVIRKFRRRLQILEMNMAMKVNRMKIAGKYIEQRGGTLWKSSQLKPVPTPKTRKGSSKAGNDMASWEKFLDKE